MVEMGFQGTPGILFQDAQGQVQRRAGLPQGMTCRRCSARADLSLHHDVDHRPAW